MFIRQEQPDDYDKVYNVIKKAFSEAKHSDGNEQELVIALRKSKSFIPELSLVAVEQKNIVGHILFTEIKIGNQTELALAPLSVHPEYQNKGIGLALINQGHKKSIELGYGYSVVLGHSEYYSKAGYKSASSFGIKAPFDVSDKNFMAVKLIKNAKDIQGVVKYDKAFGVN